MDLRVESLRLSGYLLAVADLKGDGTHLNCVYLGNFAPEDSASAIEKTFGFPEGGCSLVPSETCGANDAAAFSSLKSWMLIRAFEIGETGTHVDHRVFDGLLAEVSDIFGKSPEFFRLVSSVKPTENLGAIWSVYVFGSSEGSCAIHCSWDD